RPRGAAAPGVLAADRLPPPRGGPPGPAPRVLGRARTGARLAVALLRRPRPAVRRAVAALDGPAPMDSVAVSAVPAAARERRATRDPARPGGTRPRPPPHRHPREEVTGARRGPPGAGPRCRRAPRAPR